MANHASAKKRIRQTEVRTARNRHVRSTVRTFIKRARLAVEQAAASGDTKAAEQALREAESQIRQAVSKGVYHHKTGSRYVSRLTLAVNGAKSQAA